MPLRTKKWTGSKANNYISRRKACKKLQIGLPSFRKLCIFKGIYPHDPKKHQKKEGQRRVYYHVKDIKSLRREPVLWQWRSQNTFKSKITKHKGRHNWEKVKSMQLSMPQVSIDHLVRERYPTFNDALRDLDDCVTFMFLFSSLPSGILPQLTALRRMECQKLCKEFRNYIIEHGILTKGFISVKGIYYQCRFKNKFDVTFVIPHNFTHSIPKDVDYRVMSTFLDFYQVMFKFVVFKLYKMANMKYPPFGDIDYDLTNSSLSNLREDKIQRKRKLNWNKHQKNNKKNNKKKNKKSNQNDKGMLTKNAKKTDEDDDNNNYGRKIVKLDLSKILNNDDINADVSKDNKLNKITINNKDGNKGQSRTEWSRSNLFEDFNFLLRRETPQKELEFVILSMGGKVIFEQDCLNKKERDSPLITHEIMDRKLSESSLLNTRQYIQPQWVFDCLNTGCIIPTEHYQMGIQCPPHLSPFVDYDNQSHKPSQAFVLEHWKEVSKQFGGFVPSKKLKKTDTNKKEEQQKKQKVEKKKEEEEDDEKIEMNLDIADIMDIDDNIEEKEKNKKEKDDVNGFVDDNGDKNMDNNKNVKNNNKNVNNNKNANNAQKFVNAKKKKINNWKKTREKETRLEQQRIKIADRHRWMSGSKLQKHSLEKDGIPGNEEEVMKVNLARTMMAKRFRKTYDKIRRKETRISRYVKKMDTRRKRLESKKMSSVKQKQHRKF